MSAARIAFLDVRLIDPEAGTETPGALLVEDGRIADLGPRLFNDGRPADARIVEGAGRALGPGLVDLRARIGEPGESHKETFASASDAALAGGITTLACAPDGEPPIDSVSRVELVARRAREVRGVKVFAQACLTRDRAGADLAELGLLAEAGAVAFTDGRRPVADTLVMLRALSYAGGFGRPVMQQPEEPRLSKGAVMNAGETATRLGLTGVNRLAEVMMVERDLRLVEMTGTPYHVMNVSTGETVEAVRRAKTRGLPVTCDTAPPYFSLTEVDVGDYRTFFRLTPPLRSEDDRKAVVAGIADGTIDIVTSDHDPQDVDSKRLPFAQAEPGAIGLETLLPLLLDLRHKAGLTLAAAIRLATQAPASLLGLDLGRLGRGAAADLVLFDPDEPWTVEADRLKSKSKNSCFDRRPVMGRAHMTLVDGRIAFEGGA